MTIGKVESGNGAAGEYLVSVARIRCSTIARALCDYDGGWVCFAPYRCPAPAGRNVNIQKPMVGSPHAHAQGLKLVSLSPKLCSIRPGLSTALWTMVIVDVVIVCGGRSE